MHVLIWNFFCVLMPLVGMTCAVRMLLHFLIPRRMSSRVVRLARQPAPDRHW
jgi:hypothetical protein